MILGYTEHKRVHRTDQLQSLAVDKFLRFFVPQSDHLCIPEPRFRSYAVLDPRRVGGLENYRPHHTHIFRSPLRLMRDYANLPNDTPNALQSDIYLKLPPSKRPTKWCGNHRYALSGRPAVQLPRDLDRHFCRLCNPHAGFLPTSTPEKPRRVLRHIYSNY